MTYRQLQTMLNLMYDSQLDCDVMIQDEDDEVWPAECRIVSPHSDIPLEENHPTIYPVEDAIYSRLYFNEYLQSLKDEGAFGPLR